MALPLDTSIDPDQTGHVDDHETIATTLNGLASAADDDVLRWDDSAQTFVGDSTAATTAWVEPSVGSNWTIQGAPYEIPRYRKFMGIVFIEGLVVNVSGGALGPGDTIFQLPVGMRPRATVNAVPFSAAGLEITSGGLLQVNNSIPNSTFLSLTISFVPDQ